MTYAVMGPNQDKVTLHPDIPTLEELQGAVGGDVQVVHLPDLPGELWCNEEGKASRLPLNDWATELAGAQLNPWDSVVGTVVVTGPASRAGNITSLSARALERIAP